MSNGNGSSSSSTYNNGIGLPHHTGNATTLGHRSNPSSSSSSFFSSRRRSLSDPFNRALEPPAGETPLARDERLKRELAAKAHSDDIDEQIRREKVALKRQKQAIKILLLGQSESGKSTTLKRASSYFIFLRR